MGQFVQAAAALAEGFDGFACLAAQGIRHFPRFGQAHGADIGGLALRGVLAGGLASVAVLASVSRMSSTTWNSRPTRLAK